ncbi:hypothetical protein [Hymenobacter cellulosilyticus]|uniref:DUF4198 domain-containing protein n=1 Tax=Hymenobacter cellulosilyticus TaxID=2932248 RepID=A0A8T9Q4D0_9BACT|nr:hypothetical protein [Hymenobacter cellulosilyticus]UOQ70339.1 hypothetical protein MUN79_16500 [Hymenobacter cellulosilyticus]
MLFSPSWVLPRAVAGALLLAFGPPAVAQHSPSSARAVTADRPSTHGMLLFGWQRVYASHLPMFHSPHNYQVLLELELSDSTQAALQASKRQFPAEEVYTLEPESFVLPEMLRQPRPFRATVYRGHFERGGTPIARGVQVRIRQVLYAESLPTKTGPAPKSALLLVGTAPDQYVVHRIARQPDFDQVASVVSAGSVGKLIPHLPMLQVLPTSMAKKPVKAGQVLNFRPTAPGMPDQLTIGTSLYLEHNDLR